MGIVSGARLQASDHVVKWNADREAKGWWHSFELPDGTAINGVCSLDGLRYRLSQFPIPADLTGKRVLDIGCWDGWFSFECERRGAEVVAIDCWDNPRFREMHAIYHSKVDYRQMDMYDLTPARLGYFDIVLFMGVLYHLKHPLLALERVCELTTELAAVDSFILRPDQYAAAADERPLMAFFETDELGGQTDNWSGPNLPCLLALCRTAGFARVQLQSVLEFSACVACYRHWEEPAGEAPPPVLSDAVNTATYGINFRSNLDQEVSAWFQSPMAGLGLADVKPAVDGFGVRPLEVKRVGDESWQVKFKFPPQRRLGWLDVTVAVKDSHPSNARRIALEIPVAPRVPKLRSVCDGVTWRPGELDLTKGTTLTVWIEGLPENADRAMVTASLGGCRMEALYVEPCPANSHPGFLSRFHRSAARQVNFQLCDSMPAGTARLEVEVAGRSARPAPVRIIPRGE
jgi:tRNA (mo5U34)-methyltransferase